MKFGTNPEKSAKLKLILSLIFKAVSTRPIVLSAIDKVEELRAVG